MARKPNFQGDQTDLAQGGSRLAGLLSVAPDAIVAVGKGALIRVFNPGAEKLFGRPAREALGQPLDILIPERYHALHAEHMNRFREGGEQSRLMTERSEIFGVRADGSEFPAEASVFKMRLDDEEILTVMLHDVTARKAAEAELIAAKKEAEHALIQAEKMAAIGTLTAGIGHEINNPLYAIMGAAEAVRDGDDIERSRAHGADIIAYCKRISETIKNLSGYARPADKHGLESVDLNDALREALAMARLSPLSEDIEIREELATVPAIRAKTEDIQQALFNVVRNGMQAMGRNGRLDIESSSVDGHVSVAIRDSGSGISPGNMAKIFDPFFTTKGPEEGEGLGLFVVQEIVKGYDGTISFDSEEGLGTTCTIRFPAISNEEEIA